MKIGVTVHATDKTMSPIDVAIEAEARGFYSLYLPEHTHIPTNRRTPATWIPFFARAVDTSLAGTDRGWTRWRSSG